MLYILFTVFSQLSKLKKENVNRKIIRKKIHLWYRMYLLKKKFMDKWTVQFKPLFKGQLYQEGKS